MKALIRTTFGYCTTSRIFSNSYVWLVMMVVLWGISWPVTQLALEQIPPLWLASIRFGSSAICLFIYLAVRGQVKLPSKKDMPIVLTTGLLQMMTFTGLGMIAMTHMDTSRAVLLAYTTPLWCVFVAWIAFREYPNRLQLIALMIGFSGICVICSPVELDWSNKETCFGAIFLLVAAISWAIVILHVKRHKWDSPPILLAPWQMLLATVPLMSAAFFQEGELPVNSMSPELIKLLTFIGPVATSACFVISAEHGRRISTFEMSNFTLGVPLIGIAASQLVFGFEISTWFFLGLCLIVIGVSFAAVAVKKSVELYPDAGESSEKRHSTPKAFS